MFIDTIVFDSQLQFASETSAAEGRIGREGMLLVTSALAHMHTQCSPGSQNLGKWLSLCGQLISLCFPLRCKSRFQALILQCLHISLGSPAFTAQPTLPLFLAFACLIVDWPESGPPSTNQRCAASNRQASCVRTLDSLRAPPISRA